MKKISYTMLGAALLTTIGLVGCSSGGVSSGVDGAKPAEDLTDTEFQDLCKATFSYLADSTTTEVACNLGGIAAASIVSGEVAVCEEFVSVCNEAASGADEEETDETGSTCDGVTAEVVAGCTVSVADIEKCLTAQVDGITGVTCADLESEETEPDTSDCQAVIDGGEACAPILLLGSIGGPPEIELPPTGGEGGMGGAGF